jgi:hypothetical protein
VFQDKLVLLVINAGVHIIKQIGKGFGVREEMTRTTRVHGNPVEEC